MKIFYTWSPTFATMRSRFLSSMNDNFEDYGMLTQDFNGTEKDVGGGLESWKIRMNYIQQAFNHTLYDEIFLFRSKHWIHSHQK